jgi:hypothetical protein
MGKERKWGVYGSSFGEYLEDFRKAGFDRNHLLKLIRKQSGVTAIDLFSGPEALESLAWQYSPANFLSGVSVSDMDVGSDHPAIFHSCTDLTSKAVWDELVQHQYSLVLSRAVGPMMESYTRVLDAYLENSMRLIAPGGIGMLQYPHDLPEQFFVGLAQFHGVQIEMEFGYFSQYNFPGYALLVSKPR